MVFYVKWKNIEIHSLPTNYKNNSQKREEASVIMTCSEITVKTWRVMCTYPQSRSWRWVPVQTSSPPCSHSCLLHPSPPFPDPRPSHAEIIKPQHAFSPHQLQGSHFLWGMRLKCIYQRCSMNTNPTNNQNKFVTDLVWYKILYFLFGWMFGNPLRNRKMSSQIYTLISMYGFSLSEVKDWIKYTAQKPTLTQTHTYSMDKQLSQNYILSCFITDLLYFITWGCNGT